MAWSRCHWWKWYFSVLHRYLDSSLGDLKLWIRPGRQAEGILGSTLMMAQTPTRPQNPSPRGQTSGLVGHCCWNEILTMFLKYEHSAKKTSASDISFRMLCLWEIHFWNGVNMVTNGREWILFKFGCEAGDGKCISERSGNQGEAAQVMLHILTPDYATELERNPNVLVSSIPQFILFQPGRNLGFWIYHSWFRIYFLSLKKNVATRMTTSWLSLYISRIQCKAQKSLLTILWFRRGSNVRTLTRTTFTCPVYKK